MPKKSGTGGRSALLFDIRLKNLDHDVIVLKGNESEAASTLLTGTVALALLEPIQIKALSMKLYATLRMSSSEGNNQGRAAPARKFEKRLFEYDWDNIYNEQNDNSARSFGASKVPSPNHSYTSLKGLGQTLRSKSNTSLSNLHHFGQLSRADSSTSLSSGGSNVLTEGNYEFPFSAILPGNMPESVEGLPGASVVYKLVAKLDRGKFHNALTTSKHIRVLRTLNIDSVELSETVAVDNTWPQKVEYSLSVPSKAIAVGTTVPISLTLVPLLKGLTLSDIKIQLTEFYSLIGSMPPSLTYERLVCKKKIPAPSEDDVNFQTDQWKIDTSLKLPSTLSKCTQDCTIEPHVKVRHKLKFVIGLRNPDGHVSELRASLPIQLFISPFITIKARVEDGSLEASRLSPDGKKVSEEVLFTRSGSFTSLNSVSGPPQNSSRNQSAERVRPPAVSSVSFNGLQAPPVYEHHVYDKLWNDVSPVESPLSSGVSTPRNELNGSSNNVQDEFYMRPLDSAQLNENLRQLNLQRQSQEILDNSNRSSPSAHLNNRATFNIGEQSTASPNGEEGDYLNKGGTINNENHPTSCQSSTAPTPPIHISRANSETSLDPTVLSRVPSYQQAVRSDFSDDELAPAYAPPLPGSNINLAEVNRRFEEINGSQLLRSSGSSGSLEKKNKSFLSRGSSSLNLKSLGHAGKSASGATSPSQTASNISSLPYSPRRSSTTPVGVSLNASSSSTNTPAPQRPAKRNGPSETFMDVSGSHNPSVVSKPSSSASDRNAAILGGNKNKPNVSSNPLSSLHNSHFLQKKSKDKK
ncbi:Piso0_000868 [Millerozyma farinosa CBS 7064]|uniref:Piso0_000868 protein n=1 Tax=Pichia sorbitophila (strain ATCC MYA-4447 / BCRC 22081 / CBS 7064 / NBRC 10061 / NRRL Y-12695) TaxID=559304 RepID=G8YQA1_PICSO|nr:Piso0_000868 [Millerozyma farinosa CBS 7064]